MSLVQETQKLRRQLREWSDSPEWHLMMRYEMLPQKPPPRWHQRFSQRLGRLLRVMGLDRTRYRNQSWHAGLKHAPCQPGAKPLLLWSEGLEKHYAREACAGAKRLLQAHPEFVPVLVTDCADFAFYSRLHWLVEYLPRLGDENSAYQGRKKRYLAWRYRDALALPLAAGLLEQKKFDTLIAGA